LRVPSGQYVLCASLALSFCLFLALPMLGEEITLRNGQKIEGTIVGFEKGMFRVETEFGFALIRKDKVAAIKFGPGDTKESSAKAGNAVSAGPPPAGMTKASPPANEPAAQPTVGRAVATAPPAVKVPPPAPVSRPLNTPLPPDIREHVEGTNYVNDTFQFAMYKPPGWRIFEGIPSETGRAIVAIGTDDEQTLLFVSRQVWSGIPDLKDDTAAVNLRHTYEEYQKIDESLIQLNGHPALRRDFKGVMDGYEWHGVSVRIARGNTVFGIVGLTSAEMYQFQQAVLNKIIKSFHFRTDKPESAATP
jgi:hypothetical protein